MDSNFNLVPAANVEEKDTEFVISMAVPGLNKEDINIEVYNNNNNNNMITISSEKEESAEETEKNYSRKEYSYKSFSRTLKLPQNIKEENIEANYKNGELVLQVPKIQAQAKVSKKIRIA